MGDRGNIAIREEADWLSLNPQEAVFLYGHWAGDGLPETLRAALARSRSRWEDTQYLARVIFEEMIRDRIGDTAGYGITTRLYDNEHDILLVLPRKQAIVRVPEKLYKQVGFRELDGLPTISFEEYIAVDERTWESLPEVTVDA